MKKLLIGTLLLLNISLAYGKVYYVAVEGNDTASGTFDKPLESVYKAQELVSPGDTVYIRGGLYNMRMNQISEYYSIWAYVTKLDKSGMAGRPINYWAYPGETPVFDYSAIKPADKRIIAFYVTGSWIHIKGIEITGVQVTILTHTQSECFEIRGSNNIFEQISMHDGMAIGIYLLRGSNNLIVNCDAYNNWDSVSENGVGGNVDGFGCHAPKGHKNNVFRGCRAWFNSDDGYDLINSHEPVLIDSCWAFYNGYSVGFISRGDGNGFKAGGYGSTATDRLPDKIPSNTVRFCMAVKNKQSGFYSNHHLAGSNWYNNTAYLNKRNFNMLNRESATEAGHLKDVPGWDHIMINNLGYAATYKELTDINKEACQLSNNYFDLNVSVSNDDFISLDQSLLTAPREADGSLPVNDFLRLAASSDLINKGKDIGFAFKGGYPDLGCFESNDTTPAPPSTIATLSDLKSNGITIAGFHPDTLSYLIELPWGTKDVPVIEVLPTDSNAQIEIIYTSKLPGVTTIDVTAEDDNTIKRYTITYILEVNLTLKDLKSSGITVAGFNPDTLNYTVNLPSGTTEIPFIEAIPVDTNARVQINYATNLPGITTINVMTQDKDSTIQYAINYTVPLDIDIAGIPEYQMYPNPTEGVLYINSAENTQISIFSYDGRLVYTSLHIDTSTKIDLSECKRGIYLIKIEKNGKVSTSSFIKL